MRGALGPWRGHIGPPQPFTSKPVVALDIRWAHIVSYRTKHSRTGAHCNLRTSSIRFLQPKTSIMLLPKSGKSGRSPKRNQLQASKTNEIPEQHHGVKRFMCCYHTTTLHDPLAQALILTLRYSPPNIIILPCIGNMMFCFRPFFSRLPAVLLGRLRMQRGKFASPNRRVQPLRPPYNGGNAPNTKT